MKFELSGVSSGGSSEIFVPLLADKEMGKDMMTR